MSQRADFEEALDASQRLADETQRELQAKIDGLKLQLENAKASTDASPYAPIDLTALGDTIAEAISGAPTPETCLLPIERVYGDRVVVLPEAWTSARDASAFQHGAKLYSLLHALVTEYWESLTSGSGDQEARKVFGKSYAAKDNVTSKGAKRRRLFRYAGKDHLMEKHLRIGVKDSAAETIRVHLEWFADRRRLVIGHCGPHIPFN